MRLQRRLVAVDLVEVVDVRVFGVLQDVEAQAAGLIALGAQRVHLDGFEEALPILGLDANPDPDCQHRDLLRTSGLHLPPADGRVYG